MSNDNHTRTPHPRSTFGFLRWLLLGVEVFSLWVFCNTLFLVPEPYIGERGLFILISALLSTGCAWASGRMFLPSSSNGSSSLKRTFSTAPVVICIVILGLAAFVFALALLGNR